MYMHVWFNSIWGLQLQVPPDPCLLFILPLEVPSGNAPMYSWLYTHGRIYWYAYGTHMHMAKKGFPMIIICIEWPIHMWASPCAYGEPQVNVKPKAMLWKLWKLTKAFGKLLVIGQIHQTFYCQFFYTVHVVTLFQSWKDLCYICDNAPCNVYLYFILYCWNTIVHNNYIYAYAIAIDSVHRGPGRPWPFLNLRPL